MYQCFPYVVQQKKTTTFMWPVSPVPMLFCCSNDAWQHLTYNKAGTTFSYPASRLNEPPIHWVPMGNQECCSWYMKLATPSSIEFKIEVFMHLDGMHTDSPMFSFIFILAALLLYCHVPCSHCSPFRFPSCGVGSRCIGFPFENVYEGTRLT
jgi:hypothetical protein